MKGDEGFLSQLHLYCLLAPRLGQGGWGNNAHVVETAGKEILVAERNGKWLAAVATIPFSRLSCGYVGYSDGWQDLADNFCMDWEFDRALDGNVALMGELDLAGPREFTLGIALGNSLHSAVTTLFQSLAIPFEEHRKQYIEQWERYCQVVMPLEEASEDGGNLYHSSFSLMLGHEDKTYPGAFIASLAIPWGEAKGDRELGGYHLVWTRDMVQTATGLLAAGNAEVPPRALIYLAASQRPDGGFPQNFWLDGTPYWQGIQLDEVAFPIVLAWRMRDNALCRNLDVFTMVKRAASFLIQNGPATQQERWEEVGGYSPSTLAISIAALVCAADFARSRGDHLTATYLEEYADFLECHVESWTVTNHGALVPGITRHYIRIHPVSVYDTSPDENPDRGVLTMPNCPPGAPHEFPAKDIVDHGFLELVRYGVRRPGDPLIEDSLHVVDALLKVSTPFGPCWRRYNHDGYGQRGDGGPYEGWGQGRAWPLLIGERAHYEFAAGRDISLLLRAMESFASHTGMLPEQIWDGQDMPEAGLHLGKPTGSAMPLVWAHAEYIKLLRSIRDGRVFDLIPLVAQRYLSGGRRHRPREIWKPKRQPWSVPAGWPLRVQAPAPFRLRWTNDEWRTVQDTPSTATTLGIEFVDIETSVGQRSPIEFTFLWTRDGRWEGRDYKVEVMDGGHV